MTLHTRKQASVTLWPTTFLLPKRFSGMRAQNPCPEPSCCDCHSLAGPLLLYFSPPTKHAAELADRGCASGSEAAQASAGIGALCGLFPHDDPRSGAVSAAAWGVSHGTSLLGAAAMPSLDVRAPASMASSLLSPSSEGSLGQAEEKVRLRVSYGGTFVLVRLAPPDGRAAWRPDCLAPERFCEAMPGCAQVGGQWKLSGAESYLESVSPACTYADLCWRLGEKHGAASIRYVLPGEKLDPDSLITVADDQDVQVRPCCCCCAGAGSLIRRPLGPRAAPPARLPGLRASHGVHAQEMFEEFFLALKVPGTPVKTFRLRVLLFPAAEEPMTPEELADAQHFFSTSRCAPGGPLSTRLGMRVLRGHALIFCSDPAAGLSPAEGFALCYGPPGKAWCFCVAALAGPGRACRPYDDGACCLTFIGPAAREAVDRWC